MLARQIDGSQRGIDRDLVSSTAYPGEDGGIELDAGPRLGGGGDGVPQRDLSFATTAQVVLRVHHDERTGFGSPDIRR
ncbi:MAG: hypothetical protein R3F11_21270 [Verrucomicrobiales bacterium]